MEHVQLVVHHGINRFVQQVHGQKVSRRIHHEPSVNECWLIFNLNRQFLLKTFLVLEPGAFKRLQEGLEPTHHADVSLGFEVGLVGCDVQAVGLLFGCEDASQLWLFDLNGELIGKAFELDAIKRPEDEIGDFTVEGFSLLVLDEFGEMGELVLVGVDDIVEYFAGVLHEVGLFVLLVAFERLGHGEVVKPETCVGEGKDQETRNEKELHDGGFK